MSTGWKGWWIQVVGNIEELSDAEKRLAYYAGRAVDRPLPIWIARTGRVWWRLQLYPDGMWQCDVFADYDGYAGYTRFASGFGREAGAACVQARARAIDLMTVALNALGCEP